MKYFIALLCVLFLAGCACQKSIEPSYSSLLESAFTYEFKKHEAKNINIYFVEAENEVIDNELMKALRKNGRKVDFISNSSQSCEKGIVSKSTQEPGLAIRIFEISSKSNELKKVKLGYWRNCKEFSYEYVTFKLTSNKWVNVP